MRAARKIREGNQAGKRGAIADRAIADRHKAIGKQLRTSNCGQAQSDCGQAQIPAGDCAHTNSGQQAIADRHIINPGQAH